MCECVWLEGFSTTSVPPKAWRIWIYSFLGGSLNLYSHSFHHPYLQCCYHLYSHTCIHRDCQDLYLCFLFVFLTLLHLKGVRWIIPHCFSVNLSCLQLSELKNVLKKLSLSLPVCISHLLYSTQTVFILKLDGFIMIE